MKNIDTQKSRGEIIIMPNMIYDFEKFSNNEKLPLDSKSLHNISRFLEALIFYERIGTIQQKMNLSLPLIDKDIFFEANMNDADKSKAFKIYQNIINEVIWIEKPSKYSEDGRFTRFSTIQDPSEKGWNPYLKPEPTNRLLPIAIDLETFVMNRHSDQAHLALQTLNSESRRQSEFNWAVWVGEKTLDLFSDCLTSGYSFATETFFYPDIVNILTAQASWYDRYINSMMSEVRNAVEEKMREYREWLGTGQFGIQLPLIFNYLLDKARDRRHLLELAIEVRNSKEAVAFRSKAKEFDEAAIIGDYKEIKILIDETRRRAEELTGKFHAPSPRIDIGIPPSFAFDPTSILETIKSKRLLHLVFIEKIYRNLIISPNIWRKFD